MDRHRILIIDDDAGLRNTLADILGIKGYAPITARDGTEGLALLQGSAVDLVLVDLGLPDISGLEVLKRVKAERPATEVIILTGNATLDSAVEATNQGAFSFLLKPYDMDQLLLQIRRAIEKQQADERIVRNSVELRRNNAELKALYQISMATSRTIEMDQLLAEVLHALVETEVFSFEIKGTIFLLEGGSLRLASFVSLSETAVEPCRNVRLGECLCGLAAMKEEMVVSTNSVADPRHTLHTPGLAPHGHIAVPLMAIDKLVGVLSLFIPSDMEMSRRSLSLLAAIGKQVGIAINNARLYEETRSISLRDPLTGLANRRFLDVQLTKSFEAAKRYGEELSIIMLDIDHFKRFNDAHGHVEGDRLLVEVAGVVQRETRSADYVCRYGGEEFLVILPYTDLRMAGEAAERLRNAVASDTGVTISLGVASYQADVHDKDALVVCADEALYRAKQNGRNRVEMGLMAPSEVDGPAPGAGTTGDADRI